MSARQCGRTCHVATSTRKAADYAVALVTSSISSVISRAEERKTKTGMELFSLAIQEYESSTGRRLSMSGVYNVSPNPSGRAFDMRRAENHCLTTAEISRVLLRHQPSADILGRIDPSLIGNIRLGDDGNPPVWVPDTGLEFTCDPDLRVFASSNSLATWSSAAFASASACCFFEAASSASAFAFASASACLVAAAASSSSFLLASFKVCFEVDLACSGFL